MEAASSRSAGGEHEPPTGGAGELIPILETKSHR
jgi:hypothetical protein